MDTTGLMDQAFSIINNLMPVMFVPIGLGLLTAIVTALKGALDVPNIDSLATRYEVAEATELPVASKVKIMRARLPKKCGSCGAPAHSEYVHWGKDGSASCAYCGSVLVQGE
jgi:hypothetical protein